MKLLIISRHFPPDGGALTYRIKHLASTLSKKHDVTVVASQPNRYLSSKKHLKNEFVDGYSVRRIWNGVLFGGYGKLGRGTSEIMGTIWMTIVCLVNYRNYDVVLVSSPPLLFTLPGFFLNKINNTKLVVDVRDLWVDWIEETKIIKLRFIIFILRYYEKNLFNRALFISTATASFKTILSNRYNFDLSKIHLVYNGLDQIFFNNAKSRIKSNKNKIKDKIKILYAGNLGPSQKIMSILEGLKMALLKYPNLEFIFVGDGGQFTELSKYNSNSIRILKRIERDELKVLYQEADALLVHLAKLEVYKHTVPSKIFEYIYLQKPIICGLEGEANSICQQYSDCFNFEPENSLSFLNAVTRFVMNAKPDNCDIKKKSINEVLRTTREIDWLNLFRAVENIE